jgi:hypothetical protein
VTHNFGYVPAVMLYDEDMEQIGGKVAENTTVQTTVEFYLPVPGYIGLS